MEAPLPVWADSVLWFIPVAAVVLLPGFVWTRAERRFVDEPAVGSVDLIYQYTLYSFIAYIPSFAIAYQLLGRGSDAVHSVPLLLLWAASGLAVGLLGGAATGWLKRHDALGRFFARLRLHTLHSEHSAWNRATGRKQSCLVQVTLNDGKHVMGVFAGGSLASAASVWHDLYLEVEFEDGPRQTLVEVPGSEGVWISQDAISVIRFFKRQGVETHEAATEA